MHSFYFGNSDHPLYGVSHSPTSNEYRDSAILICNSIAHEYIRSHRALRQLADRLAEKGYHVLRFDYHGVGDSSGDFPNSTISEWKEDIQLAADELRAISGNERVTVIGIRMGATLSLLSSEKCNFNHIIMLDPILSGEFFLGTLKKLQDALLVNRLWFKHNRSNDDIQTNEYLGYQYGQSLIKELDQMNLTTLNIPDYQQISIVHTSNNSDSTRLHSIPNSTSDAVNITYIDDMGDWDQTDQIATSLTATNVQNHLCEELS